MSKCAGAQEGGGTKRALKPVQVIGEVSCIHCEHNLVLNGHQGIAWGTGLFGGNEYGHEDAAASNSASTSKRSISH